MVEEAQPFFIFVASITVDSVILLKQFEVFRLKPAKRFNFAVEFFASLN
jgi:hypothetical protein